jgi:hypothetical protein
MRRAKPAAKRTRTAVRSFPVELDAVVRGREVEEGWL